MKIPLTCAFIIIPYFSCFAEITGYWNFNYSLKATIGENLEWAWEQGDATFGTTDTFAIPGIQGKSANVLEFPDSDEFSAFSGIEVYVGAELDEDKWLFNEYSIIVDILYPETSSTDTRAIVSNEPIEQASVTINGEGKIGGTSFYGEILANNWYRMAIVVSHSSNNINYYLDGKKVGQEAIGGLIDGEGEHSLGDFFYLFTTDGLSKGGYISSVQFHNLALPDSAISDLGGTTKLYEPVDITLPGDEVVPTSDNSPGNEQAPNAIDDNPATKYLNFDKVDTGLTITTDGGVVTGLALTSANDAPDRDPAKYILSGSNDDGATFTEIASGDVPEFVKRLERQTVSFENDVVYTTYELIFPTTLGPSSCCMQIAEIALLTGAPEAGGDEPGDNEGPDEPGDNVEPNEPEDNEGPDEPEDITLLGDEVVPTSDNSPGGEQAPNAIDDNPSTKYLNFDKVGTGLTITTGGGVVTGLGLISANDAPDRDPANYILSGSNDDGATFTEIASGDVPEFVERFERQTVSFENDVAYTTYELIFPTTVGPSGCCMQIAEIELLAGAQEAGGDEPDDNESNQIEDMVLTPFGFRFGFSINTDKGKSYTVEATGDLLQWNNIETINGTGSSVQFTDTRNEVFQYQYYRVRVAE